MEIVGHGIDVVETSRVTQLLKAGSELADGWLTTAEIAALGDRVRNPEVIAGRIAAKEATVKALGTGFDHEVSWQDVEVSADEKGAPTVRLSGGALTAATRRGVSRILVSVTTGYLVAMASAIALGGELPFEES